MEMNELYCKLSYYTTVVVTRCMCGVLTKTRSDDQHGRRNGDERLQPRDSRIPVDTAVVEARNGSFTNDEEADVNDGTRIR
jgi:hypothetical protein